MAREVWEKVGGKLKGGIGDYVHAHLEDYRNFGINRKEENDVNEVALEAEYALYKSHQQLKNLIKNKDRNINANIIEKYLTSFFYPGGIHSDINPVGNINQFNIQNELNKAVEQKFPALQANLSNLSLESLGGSTIDSNMNEVYKYMGISNKTGAIKRPTLQKLVDKGIGAVKHNLRQLRKELNSTPRIATISKILVELEKYSNQLIEYINNYIDPDGVSKTKPIPLREVSGELTDLGVLIKEINRFNKTVLLPTKKDFGDIGEMGIAYALGVGGAKIKDTLENLAYENFINNNTLVGTKQTKTVYGRASSFMYLDVVAGEMSGFDNTKYWNKNERKGTDKKIKYNYNTDDRTLYSISTSSDTVDIAINLDPDSYLGQQLNGNGELGQLYASIKNYETIDSKKGVGILDSAPLLALLELASTDFVNHYLNLLAFDLNTISYQQEIAYIGAVRGLSGLRSVDTPYMQTQYSDCFIVNTRSEEQVYVFSTGMLLNELEKINNYGNIKTTPPVFTPFTSAENRWIGEKPDYANAGMRISKLIAALHKTKLSFSIINLKSIKR